MSRSSQATSFDPTITHGRDGGTTVMEPHEVRPPEKYELLEPLGRGGFGVVYKARDRLLDRLVALKFLHDARPTDLERFRREARLAARLNDPAIVQVYEFAETDARPYIAMQYIEGKSLAEATLPMEGVVRAVVAAARALRHAHGVGIVHRDVKPANILIDGEGRAYLTDFGIARDAGASAMATLSRDGAVMGTPALMSPEQARGDLHAIDARSDIYALGATLYTLLCGRVPFRRDNLVDLLHAVLHDEPPLPRSINTAIPRPLEAIVMRCMRKERSRRYQSMDEVAAELEAWLAGRPVTNEGGEWLRRMVGAPPPAPASDTDLFQTLGMEVVREIAAWDANLYRVSKNISRFHGQLDGIIERLGEVLRENPALAWARFYRGVALLRRGRLEEALDEMECSIDRLSNQAAAQFEMGRLYLTLFVRDQHKAHKHFSKVATQKHLAELRGRLQQAVVCFRETRRLKQELLDWQIDYADAVGRLAEMDYDGCTAACDRILKRDPDIEDVWKLRGDALRFAGKDPIDSYDRAIRVRRSDWEAHLRKAEVFLDRGELSAARDALAQALEIYPDCVDALAHMGRACLIEARAAFQAGDSKRSDLDGASSVAARGSAPCTRTVAALRDGLKHADRAAELDPKSYEVAVTRAELLLELSRFEPAGAAAVDRALAVFETARRLDGCQNRVNFLAARALLERACHTRKEGGDPRPDLERVLASADSDAVKVPDNEPWMRLIDAARAELSTWSAGGA